ncbi:glycosyltransferase family 8 protein [Arcticibacter tournemirensis]|uniref:Glycosyltransferase family 8 protein n=1 Tax=Arcticibacter tournemirensis TaxID=699437 RepID=A0A4Q0MFG4_9SPHI|nr:glycosyltransferase family 8 protein [Arcticibacter tournemirensis]RXF72218.1 glycosyltransferase family 8 protein [Arcticibacter tournemirensis]
MDKITIVSVCDDHYSILLAVLIKSIEINHKTSEAIDYYIVSDNISAKNKRRIRESVANNMIKLHWIEMADAVPAGMKLPGDRSTYPMNIYVRLFIPYFLPADIEKALYLDVDMLALEDISILFNTDLDGKPIAAAVDYVAKKIGSPYGGIKNYKELGLDPEGKYLNSGLILIDNNRWRDQEISEKIINCVSDNKSFADFPDQYGYNVVLAGRWLELDERWNFFVSAPEERPPFLIHYIHRKPIYKSYPYKERYREIFYKYLALTHFKDHKPIGEPLRYIKKLRNVFQKVWVGIS